MQIHENTSFNLGKFALIFLNCCIFILIKFNWKVFSSCFFFAAECLWGTYRQLDLFGIRKPMSVVFFFISLFLIFFQNSTEMSHFISVLSYLAISLEKLNCDFVFPHKKHLKKLFLKISE